MLHSAIRLMSCMALAVLFILQQIYAPLVTIWVALGEYFHCASFILILDLLITNRGFQGLSVKTQICFLFVHWFRYIDSFYATHQNHWILALKVFYMVSSLSLVLSIFCLRHSWETRKDTCSLFALATFSVILGSINFFVSKTPPASTSEQVQQFLWIVSHYLQGFAMLPQFIFCYRDPANKDLLLFSYVLMLGTYRLFYAINWIERAYKDNFFYVSGPMGLGILVIFVGDFILFKVKERSCISDFVLRIDDSVHVSQQPLLRAVYGENYDRLPAALDASSGVARVPPIELNLRSVQIVGRPTESARNFGGRTSDSDDVENEAFTLPSGPPTRASTEASSPTDVIVAQKVSV